MQKAILTFLIGLITFSSKAQNDSTQKNLAELSLEELMDISIYSASKTEESTFDAPLSSTVLTREQIQRAGCTTIMEAMRLVPGVIVREQSNGNYDIHLRGLDNVPPNSSMYFFTNSTTLVMIDNRPVYNYLHGGTFWETLPVDLNDVERIEVVRGPSSAMYGPNAESGVINIITRKPEKKGLYALANGMYGRFNTGIANASIGYKFSDKISLHASGNFQTRERTQNGYYMVSKHQSVPLDTLINQWVPAGVNDTLRGEMIDSIRDARYPHPRLSMRKYGYNLFFNYQINPKASIAVQGGGQNSEVQNLFPANYFTTAKSNSYYANLRTQLYGFDLQVAYVNGTQAPNVGVVPWKWDFNTTDIMLEYRMTKVKNLIITPGINYRRAAYNDRKYVREEIYNEGFFNTTIQTRSVAGYLRADYTTLKDKLRLVAAGRMDKFFNGPSKVYFSWQAIVTYKPAPNHILRIMQARANRSPLLIDNFLNQASNFNDPQLGQGQVQLLGNKELKLLTTDALEMGYRGKLKDNLELDLVVFGTQTKNFSNIVYTDLSYDSVNARTNVIFKFTNIPLLVRQIGGTVSFNYVVGKFQIKPYLTVQYTTLFNYSPYASAPGADTAYFIPDPAVYNINSGQGTIQKHLATPALYGGAYVNCQVTSQLNLNMNAYFLTGTTQLESANLTYNDGKRGVQNMTPKFIMNVVVSYTFFKKLTLFLNFKNCFTDKSREFFRADSPGFKVLGGANFEF
ncbi:MAG: TonB-dependent receptor plug domain-containing protein [Bacteroidota bacterium]